MGHGMCGGCSAALTQELHGTEPGEGGFIADWIATARRVRVPISSRSTAPQAAPPNARWSRPAVKVSLANLRTFPCVRRKEAEGELRLRGAFFAISDGLLHVLDEDTGEFSQVV